MTSLIINCFVISLLVATTYAARAPGRGVCPNPQTGQHKRYDLSSEVCCAGNVFPTGQNNRAICCGDRTYNPRNELCCGGEIRSRSESNRCCAFRHWYDSRTDLCCGDQVHSRQDGLHKCCGSVAYNVEEETCCPLEAEGDYAWGRMTTLSGVGHCCGNAVIDPERQICCSGVAHQRTSRYSRCCGNSTYDMMNERCCGDQFSFDPRSHVCCDGTVHSADNGAKCCGGESYHPSEASCCYDNVFERIPEVPNVQSCCGGASYSKTNQLCCDGSLHNRREGSKCCGSGTYNAASQLCCGSADEPTILEKSSPTEECCGLTTYDPTLQTCCAVTSQSFDLVGGQCCGNDSFDPSQSTCCRGRSGVEVLYPGGQAQCCGRHLMSENELCNTRREALIVKGDLSDDAVCPGPYMNVVTFNSETQICMEDGTIEDYSPTVNICGYDLYDPTAEVCCEGFIRGRFDENGYERECCAGTTLSFTSDLQTCCVGNVHDIPSAQSRCCRTMAYNTSTHMCTDTEIVRSLAEVDIYPELCGETPYNPVEYTCCAGYLIRAGEPCCMDRPVPLPEDVTNGECCGFYAFSPNTQVCCMGRVHTKQGNDSVCCGYHLLTDAERQICCDGTLQTKENGRNECDGRTAFNPELETVCSGMRFPLPYGDCCGYKAYDDDVEICCNERLHPITSETVGCCGTSTYDTESSTTMCCNGHLNEGNSGLECCGDVAINPLSQSCCQSDKFPFVLPSHHEATPTTISCCDPVTYDRAHSRHTCCGGVEHKFVADGECCGLNVIRDPEEEVCCQDTVLERVHGEHTECCGDRLIDNRYLTCCNGRIVVPGGIEECCGNDIINNQYQTCCGGEASYTSDDAGCCEGQRFSKEQQGCCGSQLFDLTNQMCADSNVIVPLIDELFVEEQVQFRCGEQEYNPLYQDCCGNFIFDVRDSICCNGRPVYSSSGKTECCAGSAYNPNNFDCCSGMLHDKFQGAECCGASYFQPTKEICCGDDVIVSSLRGETCPGSNYVASVDTFNEAPQCLCNTNFRGRNISSTCVDSLRTKHQIFIGLVTDSPSRRSDCQEQSGSSCSERYYVEPINAIRGRLPLALASNTNQNTIQIVTSREIGCQMPYLRRGHKVVVFIDSGRQDGFELRLTRNDVIVPYNRKVARNLEEIFDRK